MSHSVLRRYTPPTCTLEISAKQSPLSQWAGRSVLKHVRFQLSLDDPTLPQEQWTTLRGDRAQLDALSDTVQAYVQTLLGQSFDRSVGTAELPETGAALFQRRSALAVVDAAPPATSNTAGILLQPDGLLAHRLTLGSLESETSGTIVRLSTLQLFDLANALEEYAADGLALPNLQSPNWLRTTPAWGKIAAVSLLTIGLAASVAKLVDNAGTVQSSAPTSSQGASSSDQKIATQLPSPESLPTVPGQSPFGSNQPLPPPPPPGSTTVPTQPGMPTITVPKAAPVAPPTNQQSTARSSGPAMPARPTIIIPEAGPSDSGRSAVPNPSIAANPRPQDPSADPGAASFESAAPSEASRAAKVPEPPSVGADIPQVAEAKQFFQGRWSPPQELKQTLEYQLTIDANGSVSAIVPLGQASGDYIDRTGIPLVGEAFVSPLKRGNSARIRVVLSPDRTVQTFLESVN
ncbi:DUF4335 domain-containing protein [Leptolyngbya sp. FACHB-36]|uniref:DUF4335 domain-containing protein n=1 Tax=Leptolyngbya sp. FACHB-36 TaxID=2692808 RepID=UPI00168173C3|nr:DUF4335 domain-containing protein [Leptolyngbya sp. FACHB-36]MBD2022023.1 DUF4335 domain-containing protein [Leptolyngbya sp. FACHB-36]